MYLICDVCGEKMNKCGGICQTLVGYISPIGHDHDDNCKTRIYFCINGHQKSISLRNKCSICNWKGKETCFCHDGKKVDEWYEAEEIE